MTAPEQSVPARPRGGQPRLGEPRSAARHGQDVCRRTHVRGGRRTLQRRVRGGQREQSQHRNGYRPREWNTRAGTVELAIPRPRSGSYFPHWLLERRRRAEQVLISVVATAYLLGASTRRMEKLATSLGVTQGLSFESGLGHGVKRRLLNRPAPQALAVEVPGLGDGPALGRAGGRVPQPAPGPRALRVRLGGRADPADAA